VSRAASEVKLQLPGAETKAASYSHYAYRYYL
jgi:hypothetical protein